MQLKTFVATVSMFGAAALGTIAVGAPASASVGRPATAVAPATSHWEYYASYYTLVACNAEGKYLVEHVAHYSDYLCTESDGAYDLDVEYTSQI